MPLSEDYTELDLLEEVADGMSFLKMGDLVSRWQVTRKTVYTFMERAEGRLVHFDFGERQKRFRLEDVFEFERNHLRT